MLYTYMYIYEGYSIIQFLVLCKYMTKIRLTLSHSSTYEFKFNF